MKHTSRYGFVGLFLAVGGSAILAQGQPPSGGVPGQVPPRGAVPGQPPPVQRPFPGGGGGVPFPMPRGMMFQNSPELTKKEATIRLLREIWGIRLTAKDIAAALPPLRELRDAEKTFHTQADKLMEEEKRAWLAAGPDSPPPADNGQKMDMAMLQYQKQQEKTWEALGKSIGQEKMFGLARMLGQYPGGMMGFPGGPGGGFPPGVGGFPGGGQAPRPGRPEGVPKVPPGPGLPGQGEKRPEVPPPAPGAKPQGARVPGTLRLASVPTSPSHEETHPMTPVIAPDGTVYLIEKESEIVAVVPDGTVYIEDILHHTIRQITTDGNVFTLASNEGQGAAPGVPQPPVRGGTDAGIGAPQLNAPRVQGAAPGGPQDGRNLRPGFPGGFPGFGMGGMFPSRVTLAELVDLLEQKLLAMKR